MKKLKHIWLIASLRDLTRVTSPGLNLGKIWFLSLLSSARVTVATLWKGSGKIFSTYLLINNRFSSSQMTLHSFIILNLINKETLKRSEYIWHPGLPWDPLKTVKYMGNLEMILTLSQTVLILRVSAYTKTDKQCSYLKTKLSLKDSSFWSLVRFRQLTSCWWL